MEGVMEREGGRWVEGGGKEEGGGEGGEGDGDVYL